MLQSWMKSKCFFGLSAVATLVVAGYMYVLFEKEKKGKRQAGTQAAEPDNQVVQHREEANCPDVSSPFQRFHCVIVLKYFWLKEEIPKSTATYVANGLYQAQNGQNGSISDQHYERIIECRRRRQQVDLLLKYILRSTKETYARFLQLLTNSEDGHIATSLDECIPTVAQIQEFNQLQLFSLGQAFRPDRHCPRFVMQDGVFQMLCYMLNDVTTIETIADYLLSRLFFSVREHANIISCPSKDEQRVISLLWTMSICSDKILTALQEVLDLLRMGHVFTYLSEIRRHPSDQDPGIFSHSCFPNNLPTKPLDAQVERNIVEAFQAEPMDLRIKALKEIPFEVENMEIGSIVIRLRPVSKDSWHTFEEKCLSGDIKHFIASIYDSEKLDEGRYEIDVKIYQELCIDKGDCVRAIIYLKNKHGTKTDGAMAMELHDLQLSNDGKPELNAGVLKRKESYIARHMDLLCEEMDVSTSLLSYLSQNDIIDDTVKEELKRKKGRAEKVRYLLTELSMESRAEDMLKRFIQKTDMCLFEDIESMENAKSPVKGSDATEMKDGRVPINGSTQKHNTCRLYFTAVAVLIVKENGSIHDKAVTTDSSTKDNLQLWCSELVDPVFYVKKKTKHSDYTYDGIILSNDEDFRSSQGRRGVIDLMRHLKENSTVPNLSLAAYQELGQLAVYTAFDCMDYVLKHCRYIFVYASENFTEDNMTKFQVQMCLYDVIKDNRWRVIPIFTDRVSQSSCPRELQLLHGLEMWNFSSPERNLQNLVIGKFDQRIIDGRKRLK